MAAIADKLSITICGDGGCGKSSITLRLVKSQWTTDYDPTIEDSYSVTRNIDGLNYHLSLTDTAGQEEYRSLWAASNLQSDAFLFVYDITNPRSLEGLQWYLEMVELEFGGRQEENTRLLAARGPSVRGKREAGWRFPPIMMVVGNKCDLKESRVVTSKMGWEWARSKGCGFMETSAREMVNIEETFARESWSIPVVKDICANQVIVIVRRVAEARRQGGAPAPNPNAKGHTPNASGTNYSAPLTMNARRQPSPTPGMPMDEKSGFDVGRRPWWKRIFCCR